VRADGERSPAGHPMATTCPTRPQQRRPWGEHGGSARRERGDSSDGDEKAVMCYN
jgi:hypothetical protein